MQTIEETELKMPSDFRRHSFLVSAGYLSDTIISLIAAFCGLSFLLAIKITSKLSNSILHQFGGLHKLWDTPHYTIKINTR